MALDWSQDAYDRAFRFAAKAHRGQTMKDSGLPYLVHLGLVAMEVIAALETETGRDGDLAVQCALLHDTLEDTAVTEPRLRAAFGTAVARGVSALTKNDQLAKPDRIPDTLRRIRRQPREVWMVKLADRIVNLAPPPRGWTPAKIAAYREDARRIHEALAWASPCLADRLRRKIEAYPPPPDR